MLTEALLFGLSTTLAALLFASSLSVSYFVVRSTTDLSPSGRFGATFVVASWGFAAVGYALLALHAFTPLAAVIVTVGLCAAGYRLARTADVQLGLSRAPEMFRAVGAPKLLLWTCGALGAVRAVRLLSLPPHQQDSMTYHLVKAADYVQTGAFWLRQMPEAWTYYRAFPELEDLYSAWAMLIVRSDIWLDVPHVVAWAALLTGAYALLRELGVDSDRAAMGSCAIAFCPAAWTLAGIPYAAAWLWGFTCWGLLFTARWARDPRLPELLLAAAAWSLATASKTTGLVVLAVGGASLAIAAVRNGAIRRPGHLALAGLVMVPGAVPYMRSWLVHGSPFYPMPLEFGPLMLSEGNELFRLTHALGLSAQVEAGIVAESSLTQIFVALAIPFNFGPGYLLFAPIALLGLRELTRRRAWVVVPVVILGAMLFAYAAFAPGQLGLRTIWVTFVGRHIFPLFIALVALGALARGRLAQRVWILGVGATLMTTVVMLATRGWTMLDAESLALQTAVVAAAALCAYLPLRAASSAYGKVASVWLALAVLAVGTFGVQSSFRWPLMSQSVVSDRALAAGHLDGPEPQRIALAAGPDPVGQNWFVYPFYGARLQNEVVYVPPTSDGELRGYLMDDLPAHVDDEAWIERLNEAQVDHVVVLSAPAVETEILQRNGVEPVETWQGGTVELYDADDISAIGRK